MSPQKKPFENIVGKGENAGNQNFLHFHNIFCNIKDKSSYELHLFYRLQMFLISLIPNFLLCGKEVR